MDSTPDPFPLKLLISLSGVSYDHTLCDWRWFLVAKLLDADGATINRMSG